MAAVQGSKGVWRLPDWMEPYRGVLEQPIMCGQPVEELMRRYAEEPHLAQTNGYVYADAVATVARVGLLIRLHEAEMLK